LRDWEARSFDLPVSTLKTRLDGREAASKKRHSRFIPLEVEEQSIEEWLLDMDTRGAAFTLPMLSEMASLLLQAQKTIPSTVGRDWASHFVGRHPNLSTRLSRKYDYQRALSKDLRIKPWFDLVQNTVEKWGITSDDIFNFDESGFAMGVGTVPHKGLLPQLSTMEKEPSYKLGIASG
jgi:hypothetical protein